MTNRISGAMERALEAFQKAQDESNGQAIARTAYECKVSASGLYRGLVTAGRIVPKVRKSKRRR